MSRELTPHSSLDNLKKEAKRWLNALRAKVAAARERLHRAFPDAPADPSLRDVQHALAREHGLPGWTALKNLLAGASRRGGDAPDLVARFLECACPDHHIRGGPAHVMAQHAALRLLKRHPELARANLYTAVVCGEVQEVERFLAEHPQAAVAKSSATAPDRSDVGGAGDLFREIGPKGWDPLLYLCFTRLPLPAVSDNAVTIARLLLDRGADPNTYFMAGSSRYTPLVGVIGEGEESRPPHQQRDALAQLLLQRGAEPYDIQVLYNTHFQGDMLWFLKLMYARAEQLGRQADWADPEWSMLNMGNYGSGARWLLGAAVRNNDVAMAEWILAHGATPDPAPPRDPRLGKYSLHEEALRQGLIEMADLLVRHGAKASGVTISGEQAFAAACLRLDRAAAQVLLKEHPEYLRSPLAMLAAAERDRVDVVALLLDLGVSPNVEDAERQRGLHIAGYNNSLRVAQLLIERGAEIDPVESNWSNTPLDCAVYSNHPEMIALLGPHSREVWNLTFTGQIDRVRRVLTEEPNRARAVSAEYGTPLFWLPDDDARAMEAVKLWLSYGTDPSVRNKEGQTAADRARKRGLDEVAELLDAAAKTSAPPPPPAASLEHYERLADAALTAYRTGEPGAMRIVWAAAGHMRNWETMRTYMQMELGKRPDAEHPEVDLTLDDTRLLVARGHGFESWEALTKYVAALPPGKEIAARPVRFFTIDAGGAEHTAGSERDWAKLISLMQEQKIPGLDAGGQMTDAMLERIARLDHVTSLNLASSPKVTDAGLRHLANMPQLRHLELTGCPITDRGLDVLRHLPELRTFKLVHHGGISDAGMVNLAHCRQLEVVELMGTATGDGTIRALTGMPRLRHVQAGSLITDDGVRHFHEFPVFKTWQGGEARIALTSPEAGPNFLWLNLRSPLTDRGLAHLEGLDGLFAVSLFGISGMPAFEDKDSGITAAGLKHLVDLPHLEWLGCTAELCTDAAMSLIGTMPRIRMLMCQDTVAGDDGFVGLSRSQSIEHIWGRRCYNLRSRGFAAMAAMPALRNLSVSCKNVDDTGLSALPRFPALTELMPIDVPDDGYRHVGRCEQLESLVLMYCRDTTDVATTHIAGLSRLKKYFASYTRITDRSLELLGGMPSLEHIEFYGIPKVTNAGVAALAALPRLREVHISGPRLTRECVAAFPERVQVHFST